MSKMHASKTALLICILIFICSSLGLALENRLVVPLPDCGVTLAKDANGNTVFKGAVLGGVAGNPSLPVQNITLLLPPDTAPDTVKATIENPVYKIIDGTWEVQPAPPETITSGKHSEWPAGVSITDGRNTQVYGANQFFPATNLGMCNTGYQRNWCLAQLQVFPYQYNPATKTLRRLTEGKLVLTFNKTDKTNTRDPLSNTLQDELSRRVLNFKDILPLYQTDATNTDVKPGYVIITTRAIQSASHQLVNFVDDKMAKGFDVHVYTEITWGGGTGNTAAENIRSWLQSNYSNHNLKYVLLIGDPNPETGDVPMKMCYPRQPGEDYNECPTDLYYAELTGNWDLDQDGRYGEFVGDYGTNGADLNLEVTVGRIPYYGNITDLDHILAKTITYSNTPSSQTGWRSRVLLPIEPSDINTPGYQLGEAIKDNILTPKTGWSWHRIYDDTYGLNPVPETIPCDIANVVTAWNANDFGLVCWWTHGSTISAADIMDIWTVPQLDDEHPAFTFQCSCNNSWPEN
ncbi:MAG TPA: C25 family cysteine peptidase, partial [Bacillota bacterium]|nr:C25 family cysteine peptidase [Bacillota bacterium]